MYKYLVVGKHPVNRINWYLPTVNDIFMKIWKEKKWEEEDDRDNIVLFKLEKEIWK